MKKRPWLWVVLIVAAALVLSCGGCMVLGLLSLGASDAMPTLTGAMGNAVAIIEIKGVIVSGQGLRGLSRGIAYSEDIIGDLKRAVADPTIKAIVLEVNSPGGGVVPSADIYQALRECPKPIVASMGEVAASGGYYVSCPSQHIVVRPATMTGSIGVISQFTNAQELMRKLGVEQQVIKTGRYKDQGGLHRALGEEEIDMLQAMLDEALRDFVEAIVENRDLSEQEVRELADGRVFTGRQAVDVGLVDSEGNLDSAIRIAADLGGIEGEPRIVRYEETPTLFDLLSNLVARIERPTELLLLDELLGNGQVPRLQYLYAGP